jgi:hypothetical protein
VRHSSLALLGLVLAGCYAPAVPFGVPCSPTGECPLGQACVAGQCTLATGAQVDGAVGDAGGTSDLDGDDVLDAVDNCVDVKNPDQANEDGDVVGNACDLCPQVSDPGAKDGDGDGVGDACDPNPAMQDSIWQFAGFDGTLVPWTGAGTWAAAGQDLRVTAKGDSVNENPYLTVPLTGRTKFDNFSVTARVHIDQLTGSTGIHDIGVTTFEPVGGGSRSLYCELLKDNSTAASLLLEDSTQGGLSKIRALAWIVGVPYSLALTRHGQTYTCSLRGADGTLLGSLSGTSNVAPTTTDNLSIWAFGMTARFSSVVVAGAR